MINSLEKDLSELQSSIDKINQSILDVNLQHESLKTDTVESMDTELSSELNDAILGMTQCINDHMKQSEDMLSSLMDEKRLKYMANILALQQEMTKERN